MVSRAWSRSPHRAPAQPSGFFVDALGQRHRAGVAVVIVRPCLGSGTGVILQVAARTQWRKTFDLVSFT